MSSITEVEHPVGYMEEEKGQKYIVVEDCDYHRHCSKCAANEKRIARLCLMLSCEAFTRSDMKYVHWEILGK